MPLSRKEKKCLVEKIAKTLRNADDVIFGYLFGSFSKTESFGDIDLAIYSTEQCNPFSLAANLKISLGTATGLPPDIFDVRIVNSIPETGDLFALLFLKRVLTENRILVDKDFERRAEFIEKYGAKYRECEGLFDEVLS